MSSESPESRATNCARTFSARLHSMPSASRIVCKANTVSARSLRVVRPFHLLRNAAPCAENIPRFFIRCKHDRYFFSFLQESAVNNFAGTFRHATFA